MPLTGSRGPDRALDALVVCLADMRDGLGPYLAIYLLAVDRRDQASIGIALSASAIAGLIAQAPAGRWPMRSGPGAASSSPRRRW